MPTSSTSRRYRRRNLFALSVVFLVMLVWRNEKARSGSGGIGADPLRSCGTTTAINETCIRILQGFRSAKVGLGHQISELVFSMHLASLHGATVLLERFDETESEHGEILAFLNDLLGLDAIWHTTQIDTSALQTQLISNTSSDPFQCGVQYQGDFMTCPGLHDMPGQSGNCFLLPVQRLSFSRYAPCLRRIAQKGTWSSRRPGLLSAHDFNVVWHVRVGDLELHKPNDGYYQNISRLLQPTFLTVNGPKHFVLGRWEVLETTARKAYEDFFAELLGAPTFLSADIEESFLYFLHADMTIGSGSSFPRVAPLFSPSALPVNVAPTHGWNHLAEYFPDGIDIDIKNAYVTPTPAVIQKIKDKNKGHKLHDAR